MEELMLVNCCGVGEDSWESVVLERLLRVPWTERRSNQSILKEISPEYSLEGLMLKLKLQYYGHLMRRTDSLEKTLMMAGKDWRQEEKGGNRGWDGWMASPARWTWVWASSGSWGWTGKPGMLQSMGLQSRTRLSWGLNWTELNNSRDLSLWSLSKQSDTGGKLQHKRGFIALIHWGISITEEVFKFKSMQQSVT